MRARCERRLRRRRKSAPTVSATAADRSQSGSRTVRWGLEQGFDLAAPPRALGSGPLTFSMALSGNVDPRLQAGSLLLAGDGASLRYSGLIATDARGRVLRSWLQLIPHHVLIRVDDRGAVYPLRIDPFIEQREFIRLTWCERRRIRRIGGRLGQDDRRRHAQLRRRLNQPGNRAPHSVFTMPASGWADATQIARLTAAKGQSRRTLRSFRVGQRQHDRRRCALP